MRRLNISLYKIKEAFKKIKLSHSKIHILKERTIVRLKKVMTIDIELRWFLTMRWKQWIEKYRRNGEQVNKVNIEDNTNKKEEKKL